MRGFLQGYARGHMRNTVAIVAGWAIMLAVVALVSMPHATGGASAATPAHWDCNHADQIGAAFKAENWSGNAAALGTSLPNGITAAVALDTQARFLHLWLYDGSGADTDFYLPLDSIPVTDAGPHPLYQGRVNLTGDPSISFHDGELKLFVGFYRGGGGNLPDLFRIRTGCRLAT